VTRLTDDRISYLIREHRRSGMRESVGRMAARWGVSRRHLFALLARARATGTIPRLNPNRRPKGPPVTPEERQLVLAAHRRCPRGADLLYDTLLKQGRWVPKMRIYRILREAGLVIPNPRKQRPRSYVRYERAHSGSLLHGDWHRTTEDHPHVILWEDDASRMLLSGGEFASATMAHSIATLRGAIRRAHAWNLTIREVNTDQGCQFFSPAKRGTAVQGRPGEIYRRGTLFGQFLAANGIRHVVSRRNHPQTNGKLERLWREYNRHRWRFTKLEEFIDWYNDQVHGALRREWFETPKEAFVRKLPTETLLGLHLRHVEAAVEV
jgi:putative transposase